MSRETRLPSTKSMCSSLGSLTRTRARTNQTAIPQTTMSNTQLMDLQRDRYQVRTSHSRWHLSLTICCGTLTFFPTRTEVRKKKRVTKKDTVGCSWGSKKSGEGAFWWGIQEKKNPSHFSGKKLKRLYLGFEFTVKNSWAELSTNN